MKDLKKYLEDIIEIAQKLGSSISDLKREDYNEHRVDGSISARSFYDILKEEGYTRPGWQTAKELAEQIAIDSDFEPTELSKKITKSYIEKRSYIDTSNIINTLENIAEVKGYDLDNKDKGVEGVTKTLILSDLHAGKKVVNYETDKEIFNEDILKTRFDSIVKIFLESCKDEKSLDEILIIGAGDLVDGAGIYATQPYNQDITSVPDQVNTITKLIWKLIVTANKQFPKVSVRFQGQSGNHASTGEFNDKKSNWDNMLYSQLKLLKEISGNDSIIVNYTKNGFSNFKIQGMQCHVRHKSPLQYETSAGTAKYASWALEHKYDLLITAHFHSFMAGVFQKKTIIRNGSIVGCDELSERIGKASGPSQVMFTVDNNKLKDITNIEVE